MIYQKILQINLHTCRLAHHLLQKTVEEEHIDICIISEPNLELCSNWYHDTEKLTAIWVVNRNLIIQDQGSGKGFTWIITNNCLILSCYKSPNSDKTRAEQFIDDVDQLVAIHNEVILAGDFNAKAIEWGPYIYPNERGIVINDYISKRSMILLNDGIKPTFFRRGQLSWIDLSITSEAIGRRTRNWQVRDDLESASDHRYITFEFCTGNVVHNNVNNTRGWSLKSLNKTTLLAEMSSQIICRKPSTPDELMEYVRACCDAAMKKKTPCNRREVFWWNQDIADSRKKCLKARRTYTRCKKNPNVTEKIILWDIYKSAKLELNFLIKKSRDAQWKLLCDDIENNLWGIGFRIAMQKLVKNRPLTTQTRNMAIDALFPKHEICNWTYDQLPEEELGDITVDEMMAVAMAMKTGKAPGPDGVPPEIVKYLCQEFPDEISEVLRTTLKKNIFPVEWKEAKLILLKKTGKPDGEPSYSCENRNAE